MAGPDPRRSSRARTSQPLSRPSSTASSVSGRPDRSSKPFAKSASPRKNTHTASPASETPDDAAVTTDDSPPPQPRSRRATHAHNTIKDDSQELSSVVHSEIEMLNDGDDIQEDDEAVRCICGAEDYPGPPSADILQQAAKDGFDVDSIFPTVVTEDLAGFFVQCDICKVWQHGACVGLVNDDTLPEEYYCEWCRKDFHRIFSSSNVTRCSIYQPVSRRRSRTGSFARERDRSPKVRDSSKDNKKDTRDGGKDKNGRATSVTQSKRRSTMNSRDAAYDEEQLRIAIEASKEDAHIESVEGSSRRSKRSRSFSEEKADGVKRQRTSSRSASPAGDKSNGEDDSDDATATRNGTSKKASRNAAAIRSQQQRERAEKEEKERQRAEAANKRNGRAERRRADGIEATRASALVKDSETHSSTDSDPSEEMPLAARTAGNRPVTAQASSSTTAAAAAEDGAGAGVSSSSTTTVATSSSSTAVVSSSTVATPRPGPPRPSQQPSPETPPPTSAPPMSASKSKGGRPTHKKKGRNQYTKEREAREEQQARSRSRDVTENGQSKSGAGGGGLGGGNNSKVGSRSKGGMNSRVTMTEMKRRVAAMFDFISKTQVELAGEEESDTAAPPSSSEGLTNGHAHTNGDKGNRSPVKKATSATDSHESGAGDAQKAFTDLSCLEMMDFLTRDIVHWQSQFTT